MITCKIIYERLGPDADFEDQINNFLEKIEEQCPDFKLISVIPQQDENSSRVFIIYEWDELAE